MKKVPTLLILLFTAVIFSLPLVTKAQGGPDPSGDPPPDDTPFDGGLSILVVTAVGYGITKMKKNKSTEDTVA